MGRRTTYTEEKADEIIEALSQGVPLMEVCRRPGMPAANTVYDWQGANPQFAERFTRARAEGFDAIAADCLKIMDDASKDLVPDGKGGVMVNSSAVARARLQVEGRLKLLAKWDPKRYGDRITVEDEINQKVLTRDEAFAQLKAAGLSVGDIFGAITKPVQPLELEKAENTTQAVGEMDIIDLPD